VKSGWEQKRLDQIATLQRGFDLPAPKRTAGPYALVTSSGPTDTHIEAKVKGPGVTTGRSGSIGNVFYIEGDFWPLNTALYIKDFHGNDPRFVFYLLQFMDLAQYATGAGVPTLNRNDVHSEVISVPKSIDEQQRIVAILDESFEGLDRARANAEANLQNARELFESELVHVFEHILSDVPLKRFEEITADTLIGLVRSKTEQGPTRQYDYVKMQDIGNDDRFLAGVFDRVDCTENEAKRFALAEGDFLFNTRNSRELVGKSCAIQVDLERPTVFNNNIMRIRFLPDVLSSYVALAFKSNPIKAQLELMKSGTTSVVAIYHNALRKLLIPLPDGKTQQELVERFSDIDYALQGVSTNYRLQINKLADLRQSLFQKAFAGELT